MPTLWEWETWQRSLSTALSVGHGQTLSFPLGQWKQRCSSLMAGSGSGRTTPVLALGLMMAMTYLTSSLPKIKSFLLKNMNVSDEESPHCLDHAMVYMVGTMVTMTGSSPIQKELLMQTPLL